MIKPLEWKEGATPIARTPFGVYRIELIHEDNINQIKFDTPSGVIIVEKKNRTIEEAKELCEADYEARVQSMLSIELPESHKSKLLTDISENE